MGIRIGDITSRFELLDRGEPRKDRVSRRFVDQDEALRFLRRHLAAEDVKANVRHWGFGLGIQHSTDRGFLQRLAVAITAGEVWVAELERASTRHGGGGGGKTEPDTPPPSASTKPKTPPKPIPKPSAPPPPAAPLSVAAVPVAPTLSPVCAHLLDVLEKAKLAEHTYSADDAVAAPVPEPFSLLDPRTPEGKAKLAALGIAPDDLSPSNSTMRAEIFQDPRNNAYVVAFRGTATKQDWLADARQGVGMATDHYDQAKNLAKKVSLATSDVSFAGHSLGGGLASAASVVTGKAASTFNSAGLHHATVEEYQDNAAKVAAYYVPGDPLSAVQDNRQAIFGAATGLVAGLNPAIGGFLATLHITKDLSGKPTMPPAYGQRHALPVVVPDGKSFIDEHSPINKHGMDWVKSGIEQERKAAGCVKK